MAEAAPDTAADASKAGKSPRRGLLTPEQMRLGVLLTGVVLLGGMMAWWFTRPKSLSQPEQVAQALKFLDTGKYGPARDIARRLETQKYRHPGFAGVLEFIQGMAAFGLLESDAELSERAQYATVITYLREAERLALGQERRPEWSYALGKSLYMVHESAAARPLLEEALETYPKRSVDTSEMLVDLYLDPGIRTRDLLKDALRLNDAVIAAEDLDPLKRDVAWLQRSEIYLATQRYADAEDVLQKLSKSMSKSQVSIVLQARIFMAQGELEQAMKLLEPIAKNDRMGQSHAQEANFLMGMAAEQLWEHGVASEGGDEATRKLRDNYRDDAITYFQRTADRFERTAEATAANLHLGRLWRLNSSPEKALEKYQLALRTVKNVDHFRNRWLSVKEFRQSILDAWNGWVADQRFKQAIDLTDDMHPLFPREEAYELAARAKQRRAESLEDSLQAETYAVRREKAAELRQRWQESAQAYVDLAKVRLSSSKYPEALWNAAEQFHRGHDFKQALEWIDLFIATEPDRLMAAALVKRSRIALDLDLLSEALADLQHVVRSYPTDPATFTAQYLTGVCYFEMNDLDRAELAWRGILMSEQLSPSAVEWRDAQLSLGQLMFEQGELLRRQITRRATPPDKNLLMQTYEKASKRWQESARLLSRHLERNPTGQGLMEARYYLGKSLQREAEWLSRKYDAAETDNSRMQLQSQQDATLTRALVQFELLRDLLGSEKTEQMDELQQKLLKNCIFEIPHTLFALRDYEKAISSYNIAINRYPQDVQTLVAYIQMSQCYQRMKRPVDARNMLQQAQLLLSHNQIPKAEFEVPWTNLNRQEWGSLLMRAQQVQ